jgi:proteic killer suppression protein
VIRSWRNSASRKVWDGETPNRFRDLDFDAAVDLLLALNVAKALSDLSPLKSVRLHKLKGDRKGPAVLIVGPACSGWGLKGFRSEGSSGQGVWGGGTPVMMVRMRACQERKTW